jgi:hypothetical protein
VILSVLTLIKKCNLCQDQAARTLWKFWSMDYNTVCLVQTELNDLRYDHNVFLIAIQFSLLTGCNPIFPDSKFSSGYKPFVPCHPVPCYRWLGHSTNSADPSKALSASSFIQTPGMLQLQPIPKPLHHCVDVSEKFHIRFVSSRNILIERTG